MVGDGFQRGAGNVGQRGATRQAGDGAAGIRIPVGRAKPRKGRHQHHAAAVGHALGQLLHLAAVLNGLQAIAQPLHDRAANEHAAFQGELGRGAGLRGAGGQQAVGRGLELGAGVHQHEAARAIGVFGHACVEAGLTEQGALLVARHAANVDAAAQHIVGGAAKVGGRRQHLGHQAGRNVQQGQQVGIPLVGVHVEQHGAAGIAHIGDVACLALGTTGELPDQPAVYRAKGQLTALGGSAGTWHVVQQPLQLGAGEVGINAQAGFLQDGVAVAGLAQLLAGGLGAAVLPDDAVVNGLAGGAVPDNGGFALVGDAHAADVAGLQPRLGQCLFGRGQLGAPDFARVVLHPAGAGVDLRQLLLRRGNDAALRVKHDGAGAGGALVQGEQVSGHRACLANHRLRTKRAAWGCSVQPCLA